MTGPFCLYHFQLTFGICQNQPHLVPTYCRRVSWTAFGPRNTLHKRRPSSWPFLFDRTPINEAHSSQLQFPASLANKQLLTPQILLIISLLAVARGNGGWTVVWPERGSPTA
jgi:hypothetical protein